MTLHSRHIDTPLGPLVLCASAAGLTHALFEGSPRLPEGAAPLASDHPHLDAAERALRDYFAGDGSAFDGLRLAPEGTDFQCAVWRALREIPFGGTRSYRELAARVGSPRAARAVGSANHHNPLMVIVPCHRVIAADGTLAGYGGGLERKRWLLEHEGASFRRPRAAA